MQTPTEFALVKHRKLMNEKCSDIEHPALWAASGSAFALLAILLFRQVLVVQLTGKAWTKHKTMHVLQAQQSEKRVPAYRSDVSLAFSLDPSLLF